jgi:hypothetical protein
LIKVTQNTLFVYWSSESGKKSQRKDSMYFLKVFGCNYFLNIWYTKLTSLQCLKVAKLIPNNKGVELQ